MLTAHQAKVRVAEYLQARESPWTVSTASRDQRYAVWMVGYCDPENPDVPLMGGGLVVLDSGEVHDVGSAPGSLDALMSLLGRQPVDPLRDVYAREGEGLALLADMDPEEAEGLAAWASSRRPWPTHLGAVLSTSDFRRLMIFVDRERSKHEVYPPDDQVFRAFHITEPQRLKVVILGQDPYHRPGQANGLCFSVEKGTPKPPSLRNIHVAMQNDRFAAPDHGDLTGWAHQGVLLLNTALTVRRADPNSHATQWQWFTDAVIRVLNAREEPLVFLLWGKKAQRACDLISSGRHAVIKAPHPAARGAAQTEFRQSQSFTKVNKALRPLGSEPIDWAIP